MVIKTSCVGEDFGKSRFVQLIEAIKNGARVISANSTKGAPGVAFIQFRLNALNTDINNAFDASVVRADAALLMDAINEFMNIPSDVVIEIQCLEQTLLTLSGYLKYYASLQCVNYSMSKKNDTLQAISFAINEGQQLMTLLQELYNGMNNTLFLTSGFGSITNQTDAQNLYLLVQASLSEALSGAQQIGPLLQAYIDALMTIIGLIRDQNLLYNVCCNTCCKY